MAGSPAALVLGATGGIGGEVARRLRDTGWRVRVLWRGLDCDSVQRDGWHWLRGDAMQHADVMRAAQGCDVIVHAVNPPGYRRWDELVLPMIDHSIAAATAEGATLVLPGTIYNYGPDVFPVPNEDAAQRPLTRKGAIRVLLEQRIQEACHHGMRAMIVRAGDVFGAATRASWFSQGMVRPGRPLATVQLPGDSGVGHLWAYLPDVADTITALVARRHTFEAFARFHMAGHWDADGSQMAAAICRVAARYGRQPVLRAFPWWAVWLGAPFVPTLRELREMRYLWRQPVRLDNTRLRAVLGEEPHTPLDIAVECTLLGLGCLPENTVS